VDSVASGSSRRRNGRHRDSPGRGLTPARASRKPSIMPPARPRDAAAGGRTSSREGSYIRSDSKGLRGDPESAISAYGRSARPTKNLGCHDGEEQERWRPAADRLAMNSTAGPRGHAMWARRPDRHRLSTLLHRAVMVVFGVAISIWTKAMAYFRVQGPSICPPGDRGW